MATSKFVLLSIVLGAFGLPYDLMAEPLGEPVLIAGSGCRFPDVAYNGVRGEYLVVWADYTTGARGAFGRRVTSDGEAAGNVFR